MNIDVEFHIRHNYPWSKLPANVRQSLGNSQREYEKQVVLYSIRNQLRYRNNLVKHVKKDERKYYEELLKYSRDHLMLYPYHLSDIMVKGLRITPFSYYTGIMEDIMNSEKSYDSLPNFTAADCKYVMTLKVMISLVVVYACCCLCCHVCFNLKHLKHGNSKQQRW